MPSSLPSFPSSPHPRDVLEFDPAPTALTAIARAAFARRGTLFGDTLESWRRRTRADLGLPVDRPVVGTGHQAAIWHPGIAVKLSLADAVAHAVHGAAVHVVVDQDESPFTRLDVPIRDEANRLRVTRWTWTAAEEDRPVGGLPAAVPRPAPSASPALPSVATGLLAVTSSLRHAASAPNAAMQLGLAAIDLLREAGGVDRIQPIAATRLFDSAVGRALLEHMEADPWACATAYNSALDERPGTARPLLVRADRVELPIWRLDADGTRRRGYDDDIERARDGVIAIAPRALCMTALLRLAVCDLFVHGRGGAGYDAVMERWIQAWLNVDVGPMAMASADVRLPFPELDAHHASESALTPRQAEVRLRRAWWNPEGLDVDSRAPDTVPGPRKQALLDAIAAAPRRSPDRRAAFRRLHETLASMREDRSRAIETLRESARRVRRRAADHLVAARRDWPFPFYDPSVLRRLRAACATDETEVAPRGHDRRSGRASRTES